MNEQDVVSFFTGKGYEPHQAAGIAGNLMQESTLNPTAKNPTSGAYGLPQWLGPRKKAFFDYTVKNKKDAADPLTQLEFMDLELNTTEKRAKDKLLATTTATDAAHTFSNAYERAGANEKKNAKRAGYAEKIFNAIVPTAQAGENAPLTYDEWVAAGKPTSQVTKANTKTDTPLTYDEWVAAGKPEAPATLTEKLIGSTTGRVGLGLISPIVGVARLGENALISAGGPSLGIGATWDEVQAMKQKGMNALAPPEKFRNPYLQDVDVAGGVASMVGPAKILNKLAPAATFLGKVGQATGVGTAIGLTNPNAQDLSANAESAAWGALLGATLTPATIAAAKAIGWVYDAAKHQLVNIHAGNIARQALGTELPAAQAALANAPANLNAQQALQEAGVKAPPFHALAKAVNQEALVNPVSLAVQAKIPAQVAARKAALANVTPDLKTVTLQRATGAEPLYAVADKTVVQLDNKMQKLFDRMPAGTINAAKELARVNNEPFVMGAYQPATATTPAVYPTVNGQTLHNIKVALTDIASAPTPTSKIGASEQKAAAKLLDEYITEFEKKIPAYKVARQKYAQMSAPVNQAVVLKEMAKVLETDVGGERAGPFLAVLGSKEQALLKKATKYARYEEGDLTKILTPKQMDTAIKIANQLKRDMAISEAEKLGRGGAQRVLKETGFSGRLPQYLDVRVTAFNKALDYLSGRISDKSTDILIKGYQSGADMSKLLNSIPVSDRNIVLKTLKSGQFTRATPMAVQNALAPQQQNQNALANQ